MKHSEGVTIALLGIVIGVTGSYTWSSLATDPEQAYTYNHGHESTRAGHGLIRNVVSESHANSRTRITSHSESDDGLMVTLTDGEVRAVSARVDAEAADISEYNTLVTAAVHPDGTYLAFCHTALANEDTCRVGLYDPEAHHLYEVTRNDDPLVVEHDIVDDMVWSDAGVLRVAGYNSVSPEAPWHVE